jgi:hypothetical protein
MAIPEIASAKIETYFAEVSPLERISRPLYPMVEESVGGQYRALTMDAPEGTAADRRSPISMVAQPASSSATPAVEPFPGESAEGFETALARLKPPARRRGLRPGVLCLLGRNGRGRDRQRVVAFDGFRSALFEEKLERDRRYGTVYSVTEWQDAYMVRLEMPRQLPASALKEAWRLPDAMPDYAYRLGLQNQVLSMQASVANEAIRRLAYVSSSFPADFQTRIDFASAVSGFVHRLENKVLEVIVFKSASPVAQKR